MSQQFGFDLLLSDASKANEARVFKKLAGHLPDTMDDALTYYRALIARHHDAMLAADVALTMTLRKEATNLAARLNGGTRFGIIADADSPGCVLGSRTAAIPGSIPLWGQVGSFSVTVDGMRVRVEIDGMFGIGIGVGYWPGFSTHVVDHDQPFLSETGYRSWFGLAKDSTPGMTRSQERPFVALYRL